MPDYHNRTFELLGVTGDKVDKDQLPLTHWADENGIELPEAYVEWTRFDRSNLLVKYSNDDEFFLDEPELITIPDGRQGLLYSCENQGDFVVYESDNWGFRNLPNLDQSTGVKIALLGDSFVQGSCVSDEHTYVGKLSKLGTARSFGIDGSSILTQYATYREYIKDLSPHRLIWFFMRATILATLQRSMILSRSGPI